MLKALVVLVWPVGIAVILAMTALVAKRSIRRSPVATAPMNGLQGNDPAVSLRTTQSSIIGLLLILAVGAVVVYGLTCLLGVLVVRAGPTTTRVVMMNTARMRQP